jgi:hypothetical protein
VVVGVGFEPTSGVTTIAGIPICSFKLPNHAVSEGLEPPRVAPALFIARPPESCPIIPSFSQYATCVTVTPIQDFGFTTDSYVMALFINAASTNFATTPNKVLPSNLQWSGWHHTHFFADLPLPDCFTWQRPPLHKATTPASVCAYVMTVMESSLTLFFSTIRTALL